MASWTLSSNFPNSGYQHILRLIITETSQDPVANTTTISWSLRAIKDDSMGGYSSYANPYSVKINGVTTSGTFTHNFSGQPDGYTQVIKTGTRVIQHNPDGTKDNVPIQVSVTSSVWGTATINNSSSVDLTPIPRASAIEVTLDDDPVTTLDAGTEYQITPLAADPGFTHDITWAFGSQTGTIGTGLDDTTDWTPALSMLTEIPNATSGPLTITTVTKSGATVLGSTVTNLTLRAPVSVVPTITDVLHEEGTTSPDIDTIVGAYVKSLSKITASISGAAGVYGSSIVSQKIELLSGATVLQTVLGASGTTGVINQSGSLTLRGTVTDTRGRSYSKDVSVTVMNYAPPAISSFTAVRSTSGGTPTIDGTYIRADVVSAVQSLVVGTQKNDLKYRLRIRERGSGTAWPSVTPAASSSGVGSTGFSDDIIVGTYSASSSWEVRFELEDNLGQVSAYEVVVGTGGVLMFLDKNLDMVGVGKYPEEYDNTKPTSIDAKDYIYQRAGKRVLDVDDLVTPPSAASDSDTQAGSSTTLYVTPAGLKSRLPLAVADLNAMPDPMDFPEGTLIHVDALNVDFRHEDGNWVQIGASRVATTSARSSEYAKAFAMFYTAGLLCYVEADNTTYRYSGSAWVKWSKPWSAFTPTFTLVTIGNGTLSSAYCIVDGEVHARGKLVFGSTTAVTSNQARMTWPETPHASILSEDHVIGEGRYRDVSASDVLYMGLSVYPTDLSAILFRRFAQSGSYTAAAIGRLEGWTSSQPVSTGTGDLVTWEYRYPIENAY